MKHKTYGNIGVLEIVLNGKPLWWQINPAEAAPANGVWPSDLYGYSCQ